MPTEKVIDKAKISKRSPLNFANNSVLKPINRKIANTISADVAIIARLGTKELGNQRFMTAVY